MALRVATVVNRTGKLKAAALQIVHCHFGLNQCVSLLFFFVASLDLIEKDDMVTDLSSEHPSIGEPDFTGLDRSSGMAPKPIPH